MMGLAMWDVKTDIKDSYLCNVREQGRALHFGVRMGVL